MGARKKGGVKVHALMDAFSGVAEFLRITATREHDRKFLYHVKLAANSFIVFDRAYNLYSQFAKWTSLGRIEKSHAYSHPILYMRI